MMFLLKMRKKFQPAMLAYQRVYQPPLPFASEPRKPQLSPLSAAWNRRRPWAVGTTMIHQKNSLVPQKNGATVDSSDIRKFTSWSLE